MADESGMSAMEYYYHTIGRIVGYLSNKGLGRFDLDQSHSLQFGKSPEQAVDALQDCIGWMQKEELIWCGKTERSSSDKSKIRVEGVQLTAKGMSAIRADMHRAGIGPCIQSLVEDSNGAELDAVAYTMIGDFVVEFAGSRR
jgi:hypothetical protein